MAWNHDLVRAPQALAMLPKRSDGSIDWGQAGEPQGVKVAQLDTGYTAHPGLGFGANGESAFLCADEGSDCLQPRRATPKDPLTKVKAMTPGHGTRTATALSGAGTDFSGIAPGLPIIPFRVTNHSLLYGAAADAVAKALDLVVQKVEAGEMAPIVNISLGWPFGHAGLGAALDRAYEAGVIVVCAAGQIIDRVVYPAKHARSIAVGGLEKKSNSGNGIYQRYHTYARVDCWAPAEPILRGDAASPGYDYGDGTSYACLHVTAAAAMWWRMKGAEISASYAKPWQRVEAFRHLLTKKPNPLSPDQDQALLLSQSDVRHLDSLSNRGRLVNCERLLTTALPDPEILEKRMDLAIDDLA